jgi:hypothetical protein
MIRTFRIYLLKQVQKLSAAHAKERLEKARLARIANVAPSRLSRILSDLAQKLKSEQLQGPRNRPGHWEITLRGKWPSRRVTVAAAPPPYVEVEVSIWFRKTSGWLVVFEANRALSDASVFLVADALAGSVESVSSISLDHAHWNAVRTWLKRTDGELLGGRFYKTSAAGTDLEWIALRRTAGSDPSLLEESFEGAQGIGELLIQTSHIESLDGKVTSRIGRAGNIRVYGNDISDGAIEALLLELEGIWEEISVQRT